MNLLSIYQDVDYDSDYEFPTQAKAVTYGEIILDKGKIDDIQYKIG